MLIIIIRTAVLYFLIVFSLRLMGKKQLGELQPSELVTTIMVSNIATLALEDATLPMLMGVVPIFVIVSMDVLVSGAMLKSNRIRKIVSGTPKVIVSDGVIDQKEMRELRYTIDDLIEAMRDNQIFDISAVQYAIVETTGKINFLEKAKPEINPPEVVIKDGEVSDEGLERLKLGTGWLRKTLDENSIEETEVFLMTADPNGVYHIVKKEKI